MRLYEINEAIYALLTKEVIDVDTGEIFDADGFDQLIELGVARDVKIENTGLFIKNLESDIDGLKLEEGKLAERRRVKQNKLNDVKQFLDDFLRSSDIKNFETAKIKMSFRKSERVVIDDEALLVAGYFTVKITETVDKTKIKRDLKSGIEIPGAELRTFQNLQIK